MILTPRPLRDRLLLPGRQRGFFTMPGGMGSCKPPGGPLPPAPNPSFSNVQLLLHGEGADGSTTFTDSSSSPKTPTAFGNVQIDTAEFKFGASSILFDGAGDYLSYANAAPFDISTGDFCVECFVRPTGSTDRGVFSKRNAASNGYALEVRATGAVWLRGMIGGVWSDTRIATVAGLVPNDARTHIAFVRTGNTFVVFVGGVNRGTYTSSGALSNQAVPFVIGRSAANTDEDPFNGHIDEFRLTKGEAIYTTNFTPPTVQFPDS